MRFVCAHHITSLTKRNVLGYMHRNHPDENVPMRNDTSNLFVLFSFSFFVSVQKMCAQSRRKMAKSKSAAKKENLDDLKQELDIDYHKITSEELFQRFQTHPENVRIASLSSFHFLCISHFFFFCFCLCESNRV